MAHHLVVTKAFLNFVRGDIITDATKIKELLSTEHKKFVMKVASLTTSKG